MRFLLFSIFDSKAECYSVPFSLPAKGQAIRDFSDACNNPESKFYAHPEDYTLYEIGTYDDNHAVLTTHKNSLMLGRAIEYKNQLSLSLEENYDKPSLREQQPEHQSQIQSDTNGKSPT